MVEIQTAYRDRDWLHDKYINKGMTQTEIGKICGVSRSCILRWIDRLGIQRKICVGKNHWNWQGGRSSCNGYVLIYSPNHQDANPQGYVREHRLVMAESLGRELEKTEIIHHINGIRDDNRAENLVIEDRKSHRTFYIDGYRSGLTDGYNEALYEQARAGGVIMI